MILKQSTSYTITFLMVVDEDAADPNVPFVTAATGKSPAVQISKGGGSFAAAAGAVTEISNGWYKVTLSTTETNTVGDLIIRATASGCAEWREKYVVYAPMEVTMSESTWNTGANVFLNRDMSAARASGDGDTPGDFSVNTALHALLAMAQDGVNPNNFNIKDKDGNTIATINVSFATAGATGASTFGPV